MSSSSSSSSTLSGWFSVGVVNMGPEQSGRGTSSGKLSRMVSVVWLSSMAVILDTQEYIL